MATVILVRHGRTTANATGLLAGRTPGVKLDDVGQEQVASTGQRLAAVPLVGVVSSPLERCRQTARAILRQQAAPPTLATDKAITECDYGDWQGGQLVDLAKKDLWKIVQTQPSAAAFPGGESLATMQNRSVAAIRRHNTEFEEAHGPHAVWAAISHGDIIKSILADALGMHLDLFQRISVNPASISIVSYGDRRPSVMAMNTDAGDLSWLAASSGSGDAPIGGGAGHPAKPSSDS